MGRGISRQRILLFAGLLIGIALVKGVLLYSSVGFSSAYRGRSNSTAQRPLQKLEQQDSGFYQRYRTGDIMARLTNDLSAVRNLLGPALMYSANTVFFTVFALFFLLNISPWLTLVAFAPMPLASVLVQYSEAGFMTASSASRPVFRIFHRKPRKTTPAPGWCAPSPVRNPR